MTIRRWHCAALAALALLMFISAGAGAADSNRRPAAPEPGSEQSAPAVAAPVASSLSVRVHLPLIMQQIQPTPPPPSGWRTLLSEGFEGPWPSGPLWRVYDGNGPTDGEYAWARRSCRAAAGSFSAWVVGGGRDGAQLPCAANYPDMAEAWMVYGPFSLQDSEEAYVIYNAWMNNVPQDGLCQLASVDGVNFAGDCTTGGFTRYWMSKGIDFGAVNQLGNLNGRPRVWFALVFVSGLADNTGEGAYVDNILLRSCLHNCAADSAAGRRPSKEGMAPATKVLP